MEIFNTTRFGSVWHCNVRIGDGYWTFFSYSASSLPVELWISVLANNRKLLRSLFDFADRHDQLGSVRYKLQTVSVCFPGWPSSAVSYKQCTLPWALFIRRDRSFDLRRRLRVTVQPNAVAFRKLDSQCREAIRMADYDYARGRWLHPSSFSRLPLSRAAVVSRLEFSDCVYGEQDE